LIGLVVRVGIGAISWWPMPSIPLPDAVELAAIFSELEALFASSSCPRSTRCCRFAQTGKTPFLWPVEARRVLKGIERRGGKLPREGADGDCPLLLKGGGCSVYADRPFGCRTFFCGDATLPEGPRRKEVEVLAKRLRALSERLGEKELAPITMYLGRWFDKDGRRLRGRS
jgi:Fe-S-cluster containining protein